jgi:hypothetical protein
MNKEQIENTVYELIRIEAQTKLLAQKRDYLIAELERVERELIKEESNLDRLVVEFK